jgi:glycosyltransferase involved in cell wall biosynthesis
VVDRPLAGVRVLMLSNMYPGPGAPDYGAFVARMGDALDGLGAELTREVIATRARGPVRTPAKYLGLSGRALRAARRADVIYAHYLVPTGSIAALAGRAGRCPVVVTAHGGDVANLARPGLRRATASALAGAGTVIAVSRWLAAELRASGLALPPVRVANMGVDLGRFRPADRAGARHRLGLPSRGELVLAVGALSERKNPLTLLQAVARLRAARPQARLALVGDGPLAPAVDAGIARLGQRSGAHDRAGQPQAGDAP